MSNQDTFTLIKSLQCPHCEADDSLAENTPQRVISCSSCGKSFPLLSFGNTQLPLLFSDAEVALYDWNSRVNGFNKKITEDIESLSREVKSKLNSKLTRMRLKHVLNAKKHYQNQLLEHLQSLLELQSDNSLVTKAQIAKNQGIDSYINNLFRDWCWNNGENEELLDAIKSVVNGNYHARKCLTLGAGTGRLSYDFHHAFHCEHSVLLDINPVLLGYAVKILNGQSIELSEFPVAPLTADDCAVKNKCQADGLSKQEAFSYLLADGINTPFKTKTFDTLLTPWFIDIIPMDLKDFIPHINRLLKVGGLWVNTGSLAFFHNQIQSNYSEAEVIDLLKRFGFTDIVYSRKKVNYLSSPHSAHGRIENIFSFSARKKFDSVIAKKYRYAANWMEDLNMAVPNSAEIEAISSKYLLQAQVLSAIDGQRSILEIGRLLAKQYSISENEAVAAVRKILLDNVNQT